jgi:hypothetical protein
VIDAFIRSAKLRQTRCMRTGTKATAGWRVTSGVATRICHSTIVGTFQVPAEAVAAATVSPPVATSKRQAKFLTGNRGLGELQRHRISIRWQ